MSPDPTAPLETLIRKLGGDRLPDADRRALLGLPVSMRTFDPNQDIVHEGGPSAHCCIILDGWACCYQLLEGRRQIVSVHIPGDTPDLQSLYLPEPDFGIGAATAARVAFIPHATLRTLIADFPTLMAAIWRETLITAAIHRAWMTGLGRRDARGGLAHLFCELYLRLAAAGLVDGDSFQMPLRQPDLADALGQTSVHVNRMLRAMREEGLIAIQARRVEIRNWAGLRAAAEFDPRYLHLSEELGPR